MFPIQIVSDLHLEFLGPKKKFNLFKPTAKTLALLGDICCVIDDKDFEIFKSFILEILPQYELIIMVGGNHEPYTVVRNPTANHTLEASHEKIKSFFKATSKNLHYLNNNTLKITMGKKKYHIIGTSLWSFIPKEYYENIEKNISDYKFIYIQAEKKIRRLYPEDVSSMYKHNYGYIKRQIARSTAESANIIVLTHHCPFTKPEFGKNKLDYAYYSDCTPLLNKQVILWAYGHTHIKDDHMIGSTRFYSMPKGYPSQKTNFDKEACINV